MAMSLREDLLGALEALAPQIIDRNRAKLELDESASAISSLLSEQQGLVLIEYMIEELECGKKPIYVANRFVQRSRLDCLIEHFYVSGKRSVLDVLLPAYHQLWMSQDQYGDSVSALFEATAKLGGSSAATSQEEVLRVCLDCLCVLDKGSSACTECSRSDLLKVYSFSLTQAARAVLKNRQYLEIYTKDCLRGSGVELVGYDADKRGTKVYTSVRYQVEGEKVDIDVHGISLQPLALLLCEARTSE